MSKTRTKTRHRTVWIAVIAGTILVAGGVTAATLARAGQREAIPESLLYAAQRGPLTISVSESGTIRARQQEIIQSEVEGQTTIIYLIPEGTQVKAGDLLVELDSSRLLDQQVDRSMAVQNAEAALIRARENLEIVRNQTTADIARARLDAEFAKGDLKNYLEGNFPRDLKELESRITMAEAEVQRTRERVAWSERLHEEGYISATERDADRLAAQRARLDLDLARENKRILEEHTKPRRVAELTSNVEQTAMALERVTRRAQADVLQAQTDLRVRESELNRQKSQLERIERQIERTRIYAPADGMVVYATSARSGGWRGNTEPLDEGQTVRERQELIHLPRTAAMMAEVSIHEASLDKVRVGQPVRITVDGVPGRTWMGRVARVAPLPDAQSIWMNPDLKVYRTEIHIEGDASDLRTGMSCRAEIIVEQIPEATFVPVQSVLRVGGHPTVFVLGPGGQPQPRQVELGQDNNRVAHIRSGLQPGERVLLAPPLAAASAPALEIVEESASPQQPAQQPVLATSETPAAAEPQPSSEPSSQEDRPRGRRAMGDLTPEQMQEMRRRFEAMSPEEQEAARRQFQRPRERGGERREPAQDQQTQER